jgi:hypothetical protein
MLEFDPGYDKELLAWTHSHYGGVILVSSGRGRFRIHRPNCDHIFWPEKGKRIAGQPRYCFDHEAEAQEWVYVKQKATLIECESCYE